MGIVGLGQIGRAVMQRLRPFGVSRFVYSGRTKKAEDWEEGAQFVPFDELLRSSDFVIVTCSYTPEMQVCFSEMDF